MRLADLATRAGVALPAGADAAVTGFAIDHRKVAPGTVFGAFQGAAVNGESFIPVAVAAGAVAVVARAEAQDLLGWTPKIWLDADRHVRIEVRKDGRPLNGLRVAASASHPLGRTAPSILRFEGVEDGAWRSVEPLAIGRQRLDISVAKGSDEARYRIDMQ